jgi:hypothetical protein
LTANSNPLQITDSKFFFNKAGKGGGLYKGSNTYTLTMNNCAFVGNLATSGFILILFFIIFIEFYLFISIKLDDGGGAIKFDVDPTSDSSISNCYFERNKDANNVGNDIYGNNVGSYSNCYSRSEGTQHSSNSNAFSTIPGITPNNPILIGVNGIDTFSCYSTTNAQCRSISFACLAVLNVDYNISVGSGYFFENVIKASVDEKALNIEGNGTDSTFIIGNIRLNNNAQVDNATTFGAHTSLFYSNGNNSLSVKKMTIFISDEYDKRGVFMHESTGSFSVEEICIKPLNLFLKTGFSNNRGILILNNAVASIKSITVDSLSFNDRGVVHFASDPSFESSFTFFNNSFSNITRNQTGASIFGFGFLGTLIIERCTVFLSFFSV